MTETATTKLILWPASARSLPAGFAEAGFDGDIIIRPAFDKREEGSGIGELALEFYLRGPSGAVAWDLVTGCYLPHTQKEWLDDSGYNGNKPSAGAVDWHSPLPYYEGQTPALDCQLLGPGHPCYGDSGYTIGDQAYEALVSGGEPALWIFLRERYDDRFYDDRFADGETP